MEAERASRRTLPEGTVTMLFADVEGSTRLLYALGERFAPARARLREVVRDAAARHGGHEVDWAGDGVFLAFGTAREAVAAAAEIQRTLEDEPWREEEALRLRIGVHTGEPELVDGGYLGTDVVVAARICGSAHGGQVVVSRAAREVVGDPPFPGASFRPLGRHRLKDLPAPEHLFQLSAPGLRTDFPPLRTLGATSLPALHHRLVGREEALDSIRALLRDPAVRLVTITGPGGTGKSRLALEAAAEAALERPVHLVGLAPVTDAELVPEAIARAVGVRETPGRSLLSSAADALAGTGTLLFLDNLEHLPDAAVHVAELLDRAADLDVLATSRAPLRLGAERVFPLEPLSVDDAATLFVELAAARGVVLRPETLASVHEICRRLDGLPLAIELVAARLVVLPPGEIVRALDQGLALDMEGPVDLPERQRTLRAAIDWSYGLLSDRQRDLHGALAVFANGCALEDARAVAGAGAGADFIRDLEALVSWSLVRGDAADGELRLSMLETVREHALDRLRSSGRLDELKERHAECLLRLALAAESELAGPDQARWLDRLELELDNTRTAIEWLLAASRAEDALRAVAALGRFWRSRGHVTEARRWLAVGLELGGDIAPDVRADALWAAARQAAAHSDWSAAEAYLDEALPLFREAGRSQELAFTLSELAFVAVRKGKLERGAGLCEQALEVARGLGDARATSAALLTLAEIRSKQGDHSSALEHEAEAVALRRELGDPLLVIDAVHGLGWVSFLAGDYGGARIAFSESLERARALGDALHLAEALRMLGELDLFDGDPDTAETRITESLAICEDVGSDLDRAACLTALGGVEALRGKPDAAALLFREALALRAGSEPEASERAVLDRFAAHLAS